MINSLSVQKKSQNWLFKDMDIPGILKKLHAELPWVKKEIAKIFRDNQEKITKNLVSYPRGVIQFCNISRDKALFSPEFPRVK